MAAFLLPSLPPALPYVLVPCDPYCSNSGRGGGIRTPIPGFGDRSPNRWTTPLKANRRLYFPPEAAPSPDCVRGVKQKLFHFFMRSVLAARVAKLLCLQPVRVLLLIFCRCVVAIFAIATLQRNDFPHDLILFSLNLLLQTLSIKTTLLNNFCNGAGADGVAAFTDCEPQP